MHLRPKCSSALVLLIVHIDDLKQQQTRRELLRLVTFDVTGMARCKVASIRISDLVSIDEESKGKEDDNEWQEKGGDDSVYKPEEKIQL